MEKLRSTAHQIFDLRNNGLGVVLRSTFRERPWLLVGSAAGFLGFPRFSDSLLIDYPFRWVASKHPGLWTQHFFPNSLLLESERPARPGSFPLAVDVSIANLQILMEVDYFPRAQFKESDSRLSLTSAG